MNHLQAVEYMEDAMSTIMMKVSMCEIYAGIYEGVLSNLGPFRDTLFSALPHFHACVIVFLIKIREYFHARCKRILLIITKPIHKQRLISNPHLLGITKVPNVLKPFDVEFGPLIAEIDAKEKVIRECADSATMERIKRK